MAESNTTPNSAEDECCEEGTVTMVDVLKVEEMLEENADAVLGPGDDKNCTYSEGYLKRQPLYSCLTCLPADGSDRAGVCLACSYHCHGDHDLVELYTKRNFRCDCGNSLFKGRKCSIDPIKSSINEDNSYNQNFRGTYCSCERPYPDPEDPVEDAMIQCIICEDWYHTRHLESVVPKEDDYAEMICCKCTDKLPFLQYYLGYSVSKISNCDDSVNVSVTEGELSLNSSKIEATVNGSPQKDVSQLKSENNKDKTPSKDISRGDEESSICHAEVDENKVELPKENTKSAQVSDQESKTNIPTKVAECNGQEEKENKCQLKNLKILPRERGATFWPEGFRKLLCTCISCLELYKSHNVPFITDLEDTVQVYEDEGKARMKSSSSTQYERGMEALSSLDRVQQMEAILGYNEMKTHLSQYLAKFVENKKVVREEDIREFFSGMQARKKQKLDIPYNCR